MLLTGSVAKPAPADSLQMSLQGFLSSTWRRCLKFRFPVICSEEKEIPIVLKRTNVALLNPNNARSTLKVLLS